MLCKQTQQVLRNTAVGSQALEANTTGSYSVAVGELALKVNTTGQNVAIGQAAMIANTTGTGNVAIGTYDNAQLQPLKTNTTGDHNVAIGSGSMAVATTSNDNTAVGYMSLRNLTTGTPNEAYGYRCRNEYNNRLFKFCFWQLCYGQFNSYRVWKHCDWAWGRTTNVIL